MRAIVVLALLIVLVAPAASAALLPAPRASAPALLATLPGALPGPRDGDVLLALAREKGLDPARLPVPIPSAADTIPALIGRLAPRLDANAELGDLSAFDALDARIQAPVLALLLSIEQASTIRDAALGAHPEVGSPITPEQEEELVTAAILVLDTIDTIVIPQLQALSGLPVWPPIAVADPVGVVRIGSGGNDVDTLYRILSIDGAGDDVYANDLAVADPLRSPIGVAIDLGGDDAYTGAVGRGSFGASAFYDIAGNDEYLCGERCFGSAIAGVAVFREVDGDDEYRAFGATLGFAANGISLFREDSGEDNYSSGSYSAGAAEAQGLAVYWERAGKDEHRSIQLTSSQFGYARESARGWFVEEGAEDDLYWADVPDVPYGNGRCNDCYWTASGSITSPEFGGRGNDNSGGLSYLFAYQGTH